MTRARLLLDVDLDQAQAVADLLDLATRIEYGQLEEVANLMRDGRLRVRRDRDDSSDPATAGQAEEVEDLMQAAKRVLGHSRGSHFGVGSGHVPIEAKRGYEVMKALKQALHRHLRPHVGACVDADGVTVRYAGDSEAPRATVVP